MAKGLFMGDLQSQCAGAAAFDRLKDADVVS